MPHSFATFRLAPSDTHTTIIHLETMSGDTIYRGPVRNVGSLALTHPKRDAHDGKMKFKLYMTVTQCECESDVLMDIQFRGDKVARKALRNALTSAGAHVST